MDQDHNIDFINNNNDITINNENENEIPCLPPSYPIVSRQYVRTVHKLMSKNIVIPAPAIPHNLDIMVPIIDMSLEKRTFCPRMRGL